MNNNQFLQALADSTGLTQMEMFENATFDSVADSICTNPECLVTYEMEPDQEHGYCEGCGQNTVKSCLILAGLI